MNATVDPVLFPDGSVMVIDGDDPSVLDVPVHDIVPPVDGDGLQLIFDIARVAPLSTEVQVIVMS